MYNIVKNAPKLFKALLRNNNKLRISISKGLLLANNEKEFNIPESANNTYIRPSVPDRLKNISKTYYPIYNWLYQDRNPIIISTKEKSQ